MHDLDASKLHKEQKGASNFGRLNGGHFTGGR